MKNPALINTHPVTTTSHGIPWIHWEVLNRSVPMPEISLKKISARNHLRGTVEHILLGTVTAQVTIKVGENILESVITRQSVEEMGIKVGDTVVALIKSTEVMIMTE